MNNQKGFSLIELMIVVVIIGILSTIAVPQYQNFQKKARQSEAKSNLSGLYTTMKAFQAEWNQYYGDFRAMGYDLSGTLTYNIGFAGGAPNGPVNHPVALYANLPATQFNAVQRCGNPGATGTASAECDMSLNAANIIWAGNAISNLPGGSTFIAGADGNIDGDVTRDRWRINELKRLSQPPGFTDVEL